MTTRQIEPAMTTENEITKMVANYLRWLNVPFIHVPNEAKRSVQTGAQLKAMGMSAGFPDMFICQAVNGYHGLMIELKREKGGIVSQAQKEWIKKLNACGYYAVVCRGFDEARHTIDMYMKGADMDG